LTFTEDYQKVVIEIPINYPKGVYRYKLEKDKEYKEVVGVNLQKSLNKILEEIESIRLENVGILSETATENKKSEGEEEEDVEIDEIEEEKEILQEIKRDLSSISKEKYWHGTQGSIGNNQIWYIYVLF
jgi:hypothetical protein